MTIENMNERIALINEELDDLMYQYQQLPDGGMFISCNGKYKKWFQTDGHNKKYIPKANKQLAEQLALKKYIELRTDCLESEKNALVKSITANKKATIRMNRYLDNDEYVKLLGDGRLLNNDNAHTWANQPYIKNEKHPENLKHKSVKNLNVRSKAESMIAIALYSEGIPYRYECLLEIDGVDFYPDFTILKPSTGKIYYWEHFGLMDDSRYVTDFYKKISMYVQNGLIPDDNLIMTFETLEYPLSYETIQKKISYYLK